MIIAFSKRQYQSLDPLYPHALPNLCSRHACQVYESVCLVAGQHRPPEERIVDHSARSRVPANAGLAPSGALAEWYDTKPQRRYPSVPAASQRASPEPPFPEREITQGPAPPHQHPTTSAQRPQHHVQGLAHAPAPSRQHGPSVYDPRKIQTGPPYYTPRGPGSDMDNRVHGWINGPMGSSHEGSVSEDSAADDSEGEEYEIRRSGGRRREQKGGHSRGRWTQEEHELFLRGLRVHGREWKRVAADIKTRSSAQIRSHAQKYFAKLQKSRIPHSRVYPQNSAAGLPDSDPDCAFDLDMARQGEQSEAAVYADVEDILQQLKHKREMLVYEKFHPPEGSEAGSRHSDTPTSGTAALACLASIGEQEYQGIAPACKTSPERDESSASQYLADSAHSSRQQTPASQPPHDNADFVPDPPPHQSYDRSIATSREG